MKVLIVEDEKDLLEILTETISDRFPVEVHKAENGLDAFIFCQQHKYNLIITDHEMPFMKGAALVVALRSRENLNAGTSIIMLSAFINDEMKSKLNLTNIEFVDKPYDEESFIKVITPYLI